MKDLRGRWVFPRLIYATSSHTVDRNFRRLFRFVVARPRNRIIQLFRTLDQHETKMEVLRAGLEATAALIRAIALLLLASASLALAFSRLLT
jgi:hypothetical protein